MDRKHPTQLGCINPECLSISVLLSWRTHPGEARSLNCDDHLSEATSCGQYARAEAYPSRLGTAPIIASLQQCY